MHPNQLVCKHDMEGEGMVSRDILTEVRDLAKRLSKFRDRSPSPRDIGAFGWIRYQMWKTRPNVIGEGEGTWIIRALRVIASGEELEREIARLGSLTYL